MNKLALTIFGFATALAGLGGGSSAHAQSAVLLDLYGQGVHAYNCGQYQEANDFLTTAINNGLQDPRAYYFRGIVADARGSQYEAESDWRQGAQLEARGKIVGSIGRALARYQGPRRLALEKIRAKERLQYMAQAAAMSQQSLGDSNQFRGDALPATPSQRPSQPMIASPPAVPAASDDNPFADDGTAEPTVENDDALKDAMNDPFADEPAAPAGDDAAPAGDDPFSTGDSAPAGDDPFGGADNSDPFGDAMEDDPFAN